jgi:Tyrosine phosphatase family
VRDLGGLPVANGGRTRRGALVRSDTPARLTDAGWGALRAYGLATIVDLRDATELGRPAGTGGARCGARPEATRGRLRRENASEAAGPHDGSASP